MAKCSKFLWFWRVFLAVWMLSVSIYNNINNKSISLRKTASVSNTLIRLFYIDTLAETRKASPKTKTYTNNLKLPVIAWQISHQLWDHNSEWKCSLIGIFPHEQDLGNLYTINKLLLGYFLIKVIVILNKCNCMYAWMNGIFNSLQKRKFSIRLVFF